MSKNCLCSINLIDLVGHRLTEPLNQGQDNLLTHKHTQTCFLDFSIRLIKNGRERSFFWRRKVFWSHDKADLLMRVSYRLFVGFAAAANFLMERRKKNSETAFFLSGPESGSFSSSQLRSLSIFNWFIWKWSFFLGGGIAQRQHSRLAPSRPGFDSWHSRDLWSTD